MSFQTFEPSTLAPMDLQALLQGAVAPRPICFASTVDAEGNPNLSPFSFFNLFSSNPPILVFSPARRVRDNTIKHTLENLMAIPEVCINVVNFDMVWQTSLASTEYEKGVDEFVKSGLTKMPSQFIRPFRVKESPVQFECKVNQIIPLGDGPGAGNMVICEIITFHVRKEVLSEVGKKINPNAIDLVARLGGDWYCRSSGDALFEIEKPVRNKGIGIDQIPEAIRLSPILTGNDLGQLGNVEHLPTKEEIGSFPRPQGSTELVHSVAQEYLKNRLVKEAWLTLLAYHAE